MESIKQLSEQQQAVIEWGLKGKGSLNLIARAGCGKSSTIIELVKAIVASPRHKNQTIFVAAYSRSIADEFQLKLQSAEVSGLSAQAGTFHSAGFNTWRRVYPKSIINEKKVTEIITAEIEKRDEETRVKMRPLASAITKTVKLAKQQAIGVRSTIEDQAAWFGIIDHFGTDEDLPEDTDMEFFVKCCVWLYKASLKSCSNTIDFDDMILAPLFFKAKMTQHDWVMIDEAQDTNESRLCLAARMLKPGGRLVAVGDPAQAIFGFTGANSDSMNTIKSRFNSQELPLNKTYRCPKVAVNRVKEFVPDFEAVETNVEGTERRIYLNKITAKTPTVEDENFRAEDAILCRNVKPLVELAYSLLRRGVACRVEGRSIGEGLIKLATRWSSITTLYALSSSLEEYREKQTAKWLAKGLEDKAASVEDSCQTLQVLIEKLKAEGKSTIKDLVEFIKSLFGDTAEGKSPKCLVLSTVHKAKGREWNRVYVLGRQKYMPSKYARKPWQIEQEDNLVYVAYTRAKLEIIDIVANDKEGIM